MMKQVYEWAGGTDQVVYVDLNAIIAIQPSDTESGVVLVTVQKGQDVHLLKLEAPDTEVRKQLRDIETKMEYSSLVNCPKTKAITELLIHNGRAMIAEMELRRNEHMGILVDAWRNI